MLEETVRALVALDYPHDTWVLDEGDDDRVMSLCFRLGASHFSRKHIPAYQSNDGTFKSRSKHGNYNAWLYEVGLDRYEIVVGFDPDHVPNPHFLTTVLGYFEDPKVGYVQAAQVYKNQKASFIARGAAEETYAYYSSLQMASYAMGYPIVTGCHNTNRVTALRQVGGFAAHDADDLLITQLYRASGWEGVYVPQILAKGLTPVDWNGYLTQQQRWARSVLDIKFRQFPKIAGKLPVSARLISSLHGLNYVQEGILPAGGLIVMAVMLVTGSTPVLAYLTGVKLAILLGVVQFSDFYRQRFYLDWRNECGLPWRAAVLRFAKWPYFLLALYEAILHRQVSYSITPKVKEKSRSIRLLLWPHLLVALLVCAAWVISVVSANDISPSVHAWTAIIVAGTLALISTELLMQFPHPSGKKLPNKPAAE